MLSDFNLIPRLFLNQSLEGTRTHVDVTYSNKLSIADKYVLN